MIAQGRTSGQSEIEGRPEWGMMPPQSFKPIIIASKALHLLSFGEYLHLTLFLFAIILLCNFLDPTGSFPSQVLWICCAFCKDWSTKFSQEDFHSMEEDDFHWMEDFHWRPERSSAHPLPPYLQQCVPPPPAFFFSIGSVIWQHIIYLWYLLICPSNKNVNSLRTLPNPHSSPPA